MPLYDFECGEHGPFEAFASMAACEDQRPCPECGAAGKRIYTAVAPQHLAQPLVVWQRPDGTYSVPAQPDARMPAEYTRVECRNAFEIRRVERAINREHAERFDRAQIGKEMQAEIIGTRNRADLRQVMQHGGFITGEDGERRQVAAMSQLGKDFAKFAMDQNNNRPRERYKGHFCFEALSYDSSNREGGRNRDGSRVRK